MVEEYISIIRNNVWEVVPRPAGKSVVSSRWLYKVKKAADRSVDKHKAKFVARGFSQVGGIDYDETFALVPRYSSMISILSLSVQMGCKIHHMDMKTTFLNSMIEEEVYIEKPEGFETFNRESHVCRLNDEKLIKYCKEDLVREFKMKDVGLMHYFLGMEVWQEYGELFVSQGNYANKIPKKFHMERNKPMETPLAINWRKEEATSGEVVEATIYR
eukprot:PITA_35851